MQTTGPHGYPERCRAIGIIEIEIEIGIEIEIEIEKISEPEWLILRDYQDAPRDDPAHPFIPGVLRSDDFDSDFDSDHLNVDRLIVLCQL